MYVNVNNDERPDFGETAKTTSRRLLQHYFAIIFTNNILKCNMHIQITRRIRSIVGCEFEPRHSTMLFYFFNSIFYQLFIEPWHVISNNVAF